MDYSIFLYTINPKPSQPPSKPAMCVRGIDKGLMVYQGALITNLMVNQATGAGERERERET